MADHDISWGPAGITDGRLRRKSFYRTIMQCEMGASQSQARWLLKRIAQTNMLRISRVARADNEGAVVLRLEGQVTGRWIEELRVACADTLGNNGHSDNRLILDLADVSFLDADAVALVRQMVARRVELRNCSMFVAEQLKEVADGDR